MTQVETTLRGPSGFSLARQALVEMESAGVWPTPLNFELWLHYLGAPDSPLGAEMKRLIEEHEPFTESVAERLAAEFLPRGRLSEEIRDAGAVLNRELSTVSQAIASAQESQRAYGQTLAEASDKFIPDAEPVALKAVVDGLSSATAKVREENAVLERRLEASVKEVSRLREHLEQVRRDALTDALTGLANRKAFDEALDAACDEQDETGAPMTLAVIDIDHFKRFNDTWGHQTGDQVLRYVASVLARIGRTPRVAARYGGEEFAVIFPGELSGMVEAELNAAREEIASRQLRRRSTNDELGAITVSAGIAQRLPGESAQSLIDRADSALYASKRAGRNRVTNARAISHKAA
ncbi:GGDEF domain-containing protein [Brevundimonas balnearis]|uniref:diguanylate cyclase n=1 Tax=Brevundimonas balnearis TaxID=1572858 RepID=A0ABV6QZZ0_9CAUL